MRKQPAEQQITAEQILREAKDLQLEDQYHVTAVYLGFMCLVILNGLRKLLLDEQNNIKIVDFGLSNIYKENVVFIHTKLKNVYLNN